MIDRFLKLPRVVRHRFSGLLLAIASVLLLYAPFSLNRSPANPQVLVIVAPEPGLFDLETVETLLVELLRQLQTELEALIQALDGDHEAPLTSQQPVWKAPPLLDKPGERRHAPNLIQL